MEIINMFTIRTKLDYKSVEIKNGDITLAEAKNIIISSYKNSYKPYPGTIIESFFKIGVNISELANSPEINLKESFGIWSSFLEDRNKRLIVLEIQKFGEEKKEETIDLILDNLYSFLVLLESKYSNLDSIALPLIGTGNAGYSLKVIIPKIVEFSKKILENIPSLKQVTFFTKDFESVQEIDNEVNEVLGRSKIEVQSVFHSKNNILKNLIEELSKNLEFYLEKNECSAAKELILKIKNKQMRNFEFGILSRKILENLLSPYNSKESKLTLNDKIKKMSFNNKVPTWIISYMNTIKYFGNCAAHDSPKNDFSELTEKDLIIFLFSLNRVFEFLAFNK